jgi:hypothetical protein
VNAVTLPGGDGPPQGFAIQTHLDAASLGPLGWLLCGKELAHGLLDLLWTHRVAQHAAPGAVVRHRLPLQLEQVAQFLLAQSRPMRHRPAAILSGQFGQDCDQEQGRQGVPSPSSFASIRHPLETVVELLQIKEQPVIGKGKSLGKCCHLYRTPLVR